MLKSTFSSLFFFYIITNFSFKQEISMVKAQDLPNEILIHMLQLAPRSTVYQCLTVCKAWKRVALQVFYYKMFLDENMVKFLRPIFRSKKKIASQVEPNNHLVRYLDLSEAYGRKLNQDEFSALLISYAIYQNN